MQTDTGSLPPLLAVSTRFINERLECKLKTIEYDRKNIQEWATNTQRALHEVTTQFLTTGIATVPSDSLRAVTNTYLRGMTWRQYLRDVAREAKRPLVMISFEKRYGESAHLVITKRRYTEPLVYGTLLFAAGFDSPESRSRIETYGYYYSNDYGGNRPVRASVNSGYWNFVFRGEGLEVLNVWRKQCATDPTMRKALRLDCAPAYLAR